MRNLNEDEKRNSLKEILVELSKDQEILKEKQHRIEYYRRLEDIYYNSDTDHFRHYYSDIFAILTLIDGDPENGNLDILAQNMQTIKDGYVGKEKDISKEIIKLYDHTNLDIARINYTNRMCGEAQSELGKTKIMVDSLNEEHQKAIDDIKKTEQALADEIHEGQKKMQNEYITILGIFAAIVLAFTGGMSFSSSVLENLHQSSIYRILIVVCVLGFVMINLIWILIDFIRDINSKGVRKWWLIILVDIVLIVLISLTCIAYQKDWFSREENINEDNSGKIEVIQENK